MRRTDWSLIFLSVALLGACRSQDSTKLVVTVWSDLAIPTEIDNIHLDIKGSGGTHPFDFKLITKTQLPVQLALVPLGAKDEAFDVRATAELKLAPVVWQDAYTAFLPGQARELTLFLGHACIGVTTCGSSLTCSNGACTQPIQVDPKSLPTYVPNRAPTPPDAAVAALDGSTGPVDVELGVTDGSPDRVGVSALDALDALGEVSPSPDGAQETEGEDGILGGDALADVPADVTATKDSPTDVAPEAPTADAPVDAAPDAAADASCSPTCTLASKRCGVGGGLQMCVLVNGCANWGLEAPCTGRRTCASGPTGAACTCPAAPTGC